MKHRHSAMGVSSSHERDADSSRSKWRRPARLKLNANTIFSIYTNTVVVHSIVKESHSFNIIMNSIGLTLKLPSTELYVENYLKKHIGCKEKINDMQSRKYAIDELKNLSHYRSKEFYRFDG